jgi:protein-tyrosine-phosphatase/DNA-binding transcriptional ArsR family regulator
MTAKADDVPPLFHALAHEVRWQIVRELAESDRRVQELVERVDRPQNFVSYHLKQLRICGIVRERRSIADGRDVYYSLDLVALREQLAATGALVHPALTPIWQTPAVGVRTPLPRLARVLFVCTHNSARSQMAESLLRHASQGGIEAFSAGTHPTRLHPLAVSALDTLGVANDGLFAKPLSHFAGAAFSYIITVCDRAREEGSAFPATTHLVHWSLPDPVAAESGGPAPFLAVAQELTTRIQFFLSRLMAESKEHLREEAP